ARRQAIAPDEGFEQTRHLVRWDGRAFVVHDERDPLSGLPDRDRDRGALGAELYRVREKIGDDLQHALAIPFALHLASGLQMEGPAGMQLLHRVDDLLAELDEVG